MENPQEAPNPELFSPVFAGSLLNVPQGLVLDLFLPSFRHCKTKGSNPAPNDQDQAKTLEVGNHQRASQN